MLKKMQKFILTLLLVMLPLQFAQAALCSYTCEGMPVAPQKVQDQAPASLTTSHGQIDLGTLLPHHCGFCNLANAKFFMGKLPQVTPPKVMALFVPETLIYQSPISPGLERPNWTPFA